MNRQSPSQGSAGPAGRGSNSAQTFAQKALARAAGRERVEVGEVVDVRPHVVLSHDNTAAIREIWREFGQSQVMIPDKMAITLDHAVPAPTTRHAQNHAEIRRFVQEQGIRHFFEVGRGICHQVLSEEALALPGQTILGADSHTPHFGWLGAFGAGIGRSEVAALWATGELWLRVPESIRIELDSELPKGVTAKDLALRIIGDWGADGGLYASVEFSGSGVEAMSIDSRMALANMMAEFGAKSSYISPDGKTRSYLEAALERRAVREKEAGTAEDFPLRVAESQLFPDEAAAYAATYRYSAGELEPTVSCPHTVDNVAPLSAVAGTVVQQAFIGTCTNGRLEDIAEAAEILQGRQIAAGTRLLIIPASSMVLQEAMQRGYIQALVAAGAAIGTPGCGPCMGNHMGVPATGEVTISSANRNFRGRMGTTEAEIYLASPAVVAASAVAGRIADPRDIVQVK